MFEKDVDAAVRKLQAKAWDKGYSAGHESACSELDDSPFKISCLPRLNPYGASIGNLYSGSIRDDARHLEAKAWDEGYKAGYDAVRDKVKGSTFRTISVNRNPYQQFGI